MSIDYASSVETPGCVLMPNEDTSRNFEPSRRFVVLVSGTMTGNITLHGIPSAILEDDDITDKTTYWTELEPGFEITSTDKTGAFDCMPGLVVQSAGGEYGTRHAIYFGVTHTNLEA